MHCWKRRQTVFSELSLGALPVTGSRYGLWAGLSCKRPPCSCWRQWAFTAVFAARRVMPGSLVRWAGFRFSRRVSRHREKSITSLGFEPVRSSAASSQRRSSNCCYIAKIRPSAQEQHQRNRRTRRSPPRWNRATALRLATIGGVATMLIPILWPRLYLPSLSQIVITSLVVLDRDAASTHFRALLRILGCLVGGAFGLLTILFGTD